MNSTIISFTPGAQAVEAYDPIRAGIAEFKQKFSGLVFDALDTESGIAAAKKVAREAAKPRIQLDKIRKELKGPVLAYGKLLDADATAILAELAPIENALLNQISRAEQAIEDAKHAKLVAEQNRVAGIRAQIAQIAALPVEFAAASPNDIRAQLDNLTAQRPTGEQFHEFLEEALTAVETAVAQLNNLLASAEALETARKQHDEEQRVARHQTRIAAIRTSAAGLIGLEPGELKLRAQKLRERLTQTRADSFDEFAEEAVAAIGVALAATHQLELQADDAIELAQLRAAKEAARKTAEEEAERARLAEAETQESKPVVIEPEPAPTAAPIFTSPASETLTLSQSFAGQFADDEEESGEAVPSADAIVQAVAGFYLVPEDIARGWLRTLTF